MGIREKLNKPGAIALISIGFIALIAFIWFSRDSESESQIFINKAYFTIDDGATFFVDDAHKLPPFDYQGKPAYQCMVYLKDGKKFAGYLLRYPVEAKKRFEEAMKKNDPAIGMREGTLLKASLEVKAPGAGDWLAASSPAAVAIMNPPGNPDPVLP